MKALGSSRIAVAALALCVVVGCGGCGGGGGGAEPPQWLVARDGDVLRVHWGAGTDFPQYAALHLSSSYFRMNYGPDSGWGTSVVLLPALWSGGTYYQGAPVTVATAVASRNLVITLSGTVHGLAVQGTVTIKPPSGGVLTAGVHMTTTGSVALDDRPGEAFKPVMLSSMHVSDDQWDTQAAIVGGAPQALPAGGWIVQPPVSVTTFGLRGGDSSWKTNAPTMEVAMQAAAQVTGWVTAATDPNQDNVGLWAASDTVLGAWDYTLTARQ